MDGFVITPIAGSRIVHVKIADGSEGMAHSDGIHCASLDDAFSVMRLILGLGAAVDLGENVARMKDAYARRNTSPLAA